MLRLDWNILFNIINLIILYILMKKFLFGPVNRIIAKRQEEADARFVQASEKEEKAQESIKQYAALLADASDEKERIVAEAKQEASDAYRRMIDEAKVRAEEIVDKAKLDAENEKKVILQQADSAVRELAVNAAARMVGAADNAENDSALYEQFLKKVES